jgi:hypothetical protein
MLLEAPMKTLLLLPLLLTFVSPVQNPSASPDRGSVAVLGFKCIRSRQNVTTPDPAAAPAREMTAANKSIPRNARINDPMGARDPNEDTIDGRSAAIEKIVQESRTPRTKVTDGFAYLVKVQNASSKVIEFLFWEYQFIDPSNPANVTRRQFLCVAKIKPDKEKELQAFGVSGPGEVISVGSLANPSAALFQEKVVINRVEYVDGSVWQRRAWNSNEIKLTYLRAMATPWEPSEMCRGL